VESLDNQKLKFSTIGMGLTVYLDNSWAKQFSGALVEEQPDYHMAAGLPKDIERRSAIANQAFRISMRLCMMHGTAMCGTIATHD
jgi:hypothetical protein